MAFNINDMTSALNKKNGVLTGAHFDVQITPPASVKVGDVAILKQFCMSAQLPGLVLRMQDIKPWNLGFPQKRPVLGDYDDLQLGFIADGSAEVFELFHNWMQAIYQWDSAVNVNGTVNGLKQTEFNYPVDYEGTISIQVYDTSGKPAIKYNFFQIFPLQLQSTPVSWDGHEEFMKVQVAFCFDWFNCDKMSQNIDYGKGIPAPGVPTPPPRP